MRIPLDWLDELVKLEDSDPQAVLAALVRVGLEEEAVDAPIVSGPVVVGQVLTVEPEEHSNGKTINWCSVQVAPDGQLAADGGEAIRGIVCGAHNFVAGDKVVVTLPGAVLPGDFKIAARKTYGHVSDGMIASTKELGLGDDHDGILRFVDIGMDPEVGDDAKAILGLDHTTVEINVTPDRGYAFSMRGVARDYSHSTGVLFTDPASQVKVIAASGRQVTVSDPQPIREQPAVRAFSTRVVEGVKANTTTPMWMAARLRNAGIRSLSLIVDITNYVMLELGNPIHAYDLDMVQGQLGVRRAAAGEKLRTLDDKVRDLDPEDLVIVDDSGVIGLAGVMGGASTEVSETTTRVLVEAANFDPVSIARTARRHKLPSEASKRFERGVDPLISSIAASRVVELLVELGGGTATSEGSDAEVIYTPRLVELDKNYAQARVGVAYTDDEQQQVLEMIGCQLVDNGKSWTVTTPSWRSDMVGKDDLVEEIARINGYDKIPSLLPTAPAGRGLTFAQRLRQQVADALAFAGGYEVTSYPFMTATENAEFEGAKDVAQVELANPLDASRPFLRRGLIPGVLQTAKRNLDRGTTSAKLYEVGRVFRPGKAKLGMDVLPPAATLPSAEQLAELDASVPDQPYWLATVQYGDRVHKQPQQQEQRTDWQDAIATAREVLAVVGLGDKLVIEQAAISGFHPGRAASLLVEANGVTTQVGVAGELHPKVASQYDLPGRIAVTQVDLDLLTSLAPEVREAKAIVTYPVATQDLSLIVDVDCVAGDLQQVLVSGCGELLESISLVGDYRGDSVPTGKKSLTYAMKFRAADRTLTQAEATEAKQGGVDAAAKRFGATVRV